MKKLVHIVILSCCLTACFQKAEPDKDDVRGGKWEYEEEKVEADRQSDLAASMTADSLEDSVDWLHRGLLHYVSKVDWLETDTIWHYPERKKIRIGHHAGLPLYLMLGEFFDDIDYDGAKIYWGDSLIYATDLALVNDWQTCRVHHVPQSNVTYVLLLIDDRPSPNYWHILCMNGQHVHLADYVLAGNDYVPGARYFHDNIIYGDIDADNVVEVGGKYWTEIWKDSMIYQPCYIYELGHTLVLDSVTSKVETIKANGEFHGFRGGKPIYNPHEDQHQFDEETMDNY